VVSAVEATVARAGTTVERLRAEAAAGGFSSDAARRAWFVVEPLLGTYNREARR
jgi:hypothetical protein